MPYLAWLLWTYTIFVLQLTCAPQMAVGACAPHLVLVGLLLLVARCAGTGGMLSAVAWGLLADGLSPDCPGTEVLVCVLVTYGWQQFRCRDLFSGLWGGALLAGVLMLLGLALSSLVHAWGGGLQVDLRSAAETLLGTVLYSTGLWLLISFADAWWGTAAGGPRVRLMTRSVNRWSMLSE